MTEDAGKKRFIKTFLQQIQPGEGYVEDIWIERTVRLPGSEDKGSTAKSLSGKQVSNITQLLEDDLRHTFDDGFFTFRFVAALVGSGKTSLLTYLYELTKTKATYRNLSVVVRFKLSDARMVGINQSFSIKLYCHILAHTLWELLHNSDISTLAKGVAERILSELLESAEVAQLKAATNFKIQFYPKFNKYVAESAVGFEDLFFHVISQISEVEPKFTFVYLADELDSLQQFPDDINETRLIFKQLIKKASDDFKSQVRLMIYLVGTSENVKGFISGDSPLENLVSRSVINLNKGYVNEFEMIRQKIDERIEKAYKNYKYFPKAWQEIKNIKFNVADNLKKFCQGYVAAVLQIHQTYFEEAPEQRFEGDARQLMEAQCKQLWANYLNKTAYKLSTVTTTTVIKGHAFDCYVELLHNNNCVARAFGEAKNYELLSGHLETLKQWLKDVDFKPSKSDGHPPDLAFMIAPSCPSLLKRKLELQNIQFIEADKIVPQIETINPLETSQPSEIIEPPGAININKGYKNALIAAFKGSGMKKTTIDMLILRRDKKPYKDLDDLISDLNSTSAVKAKLKEKLDKGEICF